MKKTVYCCMIAAATLSLVGCASQPRHLPVQQQKPIEPVMVQDKEKKKPKDDAALAGISADDIGDVLGIREVFLPTQDGKIVPCFIRGENGITCDWENAEKGKITTP